ncbi:acyltransferase [bacterium]|nr:MAG: acyltransferase [bacterium]
MRNENAKNHEADPSVHLLYLDGLRGLAALWVLMNHIWVQIWPVFRNQWPSQLTWHTTGWLLYGHFAVDIFIVLSGFCLMKPVVKNDGVLFGGAKNFYKRRARRILPTYYFAIAFCLILIVTLVGQHTGTPWDLSVPVQPISIVTHVLLIHDIFSDRGGLEINGAFWSIAVEWHIYFLFPAMLILWKKIGAIKTTGIAILIAYYINFLLSGTPYIKTTPHYLALFALGMLGAQIAFSDLPLWQRVKTSFHWKLITLSLATILLAWCVTWGWYGTSTYLAFVDFVVGLTTMSLLVMLDSQSANDTLRRLLSGRVLVFIGTIAYSLYLIHLPLVQFVWQYVVNPLHLNPELSFSLLTLLAVPAIIGCSYLFYLCCEKPFIGRKAQKVTQPTETRKFLFLRKRTFDTI